MGNKIISIITISVMLVIFTLLVAFISFDIQVTQTKRIVKEFTEQIQYNGFITLQDYRTILQKMPMNGSRLEITCIRTGDDGVVDMDLTPDILGLSRNTSNTLTSIDVTNTNNVSNGKYTFKIGDVVKVDLYNTDRTVVDTITNSLFGKSSSSLKLIASDTEVVVHVKE